MFAYIPARGGSQRIPRKNIRKLGGKPVLFHVLEALRQVPELTGIAVSSDDLEILDLAASVGGVTTLDPRKADLAGPGTTFMDLVDHDVPRFMDHFNDDDILFVLATAALVPPVDYAAAYRRYLEQPSGVVMSIRTMDREIWWSLKGEPDTGLSPMFPEVHGNPTHTLPETYVDAGCFYAFNGHQMAGHHQFVDLQPVRGYVLDSEIAIDVDTPEQWTNLSDAWDAREHPESELNRGSP